LIKKAVNEHNRLIQLFESEDNVKSNLSLIEIELKEHIRFEERTLFNAIQNASTTKVFKMIEMLQDENTFCVNWEDTFWKTNHTIPNN
jgi:iron-sulfur cluster repair protein YtfE (RIC family)